MKPHASSRRVLRQLAVAVWLGIWISPASADDIAEYMEKGQVAFNRADIVDAMNWYRKAAQAGHPPAQVRLAQLLDYSEQNEAAAGWYRKAAEQGYAEAQFELAGMYANGEGVAKDEARAVELYGQAAAQDFARAIQVLAWAYENGKLGLATDHAKTVELLQRGVELGERAAIVRLAAAYNKGELGLPTDPAMAQSLLSRIDAAPAEPDKRK